MSDDYVYLSLRNHIVVSPVNPNESLYSSLRDRLVQEDEVREQVGNGQALAGFSLVGEKANIRICIINDDTIDTLVSNEQFYLPPEKSPPLKLLIVNHRDPFHPRAGGAEIDLLETFKRLAHKGFEVHWLSEDAGQSGEVEGIRFIRAGNSFTLHLHSLLKAGKYQLVLDSVAHAVPFLSNLVNTCTVAKIHHVHQEVLPYELPPYAAYPLKLAERFCRFYGNVVVPSNYTKGEAVKLGISPHKITVIPEGMNHSLYTPGEKSDQPFILWLHRMKRYKNPLDAVEAFKLARERGLKAKLVMAGGGEMEYRVREEAKRVDGVEVLGRVGEEEKRVLLRRAWLFLSTSLMEGWGLSVLEANASGTPALVYGVGSLNELVIDGVNGFKVRYGDVEDMAELMVQLFEDQKRLRGLWNSSHVESLKYDWDRTADMYYQYLTELECVRGGTK